MCGICGRVSAISIESPASVLAMQAAMVHRGPDGGGEFVRERVQLAMRRLSIIDLEGGWQPLHNEDKTLALVANGEVYNFVELREQLKARGHRFATGSDCETILHLYEEHGPDCVHHLRGMYAFALWDEPKKRLLIVRDRMGEKPLYLHEKDGELLFASEMSALLASGEVPFELDPVSINDYFHYQYVPEPATPLKGVRKLPAGTRLLVSLDPWEVTQETYWRMEDAPALPEQARTNAAAAQAIAACLDEAHRLVIRSDVPVGLALSGGLDSSAVAALAAKYAPDTLHAFSVGYPGRPGNDERRMARDLAEHLGLIFHEVELAEDEMAAGFSDLVMWRDDPIADISGWGYYAVQRAAREAGVPVMLQGQGGDELFWGYPWVAEGARQTLAKDRILRRGVLNWSRWRQTLKQGPAGRMIFIDQAPDYQLALAGARDLYAPKFLEELGDSHPSRHFTFPRSWIKGWPNVGVAITGLIAKTYLLENGIAQGDRLSMASSIELRLPLVDFKLVETAIGLRKAVCDIPTPEEGPKTRLKAALRGTLPDWVMDRPKQGFAPPVRQWHAAIFQRFGRLLADGFLVQEGVLTPEAARALSAGPFPDAAICPLSFKALVMELWARRMQAPTVREE